MSDCREGTGKMELCNPYKVWPLPLRAKFILKDIKKIARPSHCWLHTCKVHCDCNWSDRPSLKHHSTNTSFMLLWRGSVKLKPSSLYRARDQRKVPGEKNFLPSLDIWDAAFCCDEPSLRHTPVTLANKCRFTMKHWDNVLLKTLPKAQRTRGLSSSYQSYFFRSYHKFLPKSWSNFICYIRQRINFKISTKHQHLD